MTSGKTVDEDIPERPAPLPAWELPPVPRIEDFKPEEASNQFSSYRTKLSHHRTRLSTHRTDLSEYRTGLSSHRTKLSTGRTDMSMRRTGMSFQRTRMSAERTLMSVIRTALSLISFGFTIFQIFNKALQLPGVKLGSHAPQNFGTALVALGILMLSVGILYHIRFMRGLRSERNAMIGDRLIHGESAYPASFTLMTALILLAIGLLAIASMVFGMGPFE